MGNKNLSRDTKTTLVQAPLASGGTDVASDYVDMAGFDGVVFNGIIGTASNSTDVATLHAVSSSATSSTGTAISGATQTSSTGSAGDDKFFELDVYRPRDRFVRVQLTRSAAVVWGGTIAKQYNPDVKPTVHSSSTAVSTGTPAVLVVPQTT